MGENLDFPKPQRQKRRIAVLIFDIVALYVLFYIVLLFGTKNGFDEVIVTAVILVGLTAVIVSINRKLKTFTRERSITADTSQAMTRAASYQIVLLVGVPILTNVRVPRNIENWLPFGLGGVIRAVLKGDKSDLDVDWFTTVGGQITGILIFNLFFITFMGV